MIRFLSSSFYKPYLSLLESGSGDFFFCQTSDIVPVWRSPVTAIRATDKHRERGGVGGGEGCAI